MNYEELFVNPAGQTSRPQFIGGLIPLLAAFAFYYFLVWGPTGRFGFVILLFPAFVLHARRLHDMGHTAWLLLAPIALTAAAVWLVLVSPGTLVQSSTAWIALAVATGFVFWGAVGKRRIEANRIGESAA